jgi:glycosyltransferase involved in cell wall biosynthesis
MKVLFLSDNFPPEVNAPASRTFEHCREWVRLGIDVTVLTCQPNFPEGKLFPGYSNNLYRKEIIEGITTIRVFTYITANEGFIKRTLDYISFSVSAFLFGLFVKTDIIVATSPQFFTALSARFLAFFKRRPWIMEVRDLWPETIATVGALKKEGRIYWFLEKIELHLYKSANKIITFKDRIKNRGIQPSKISVVKNGANLELFVPREKNIDLLRKLGLEHKFIIGFIGTLGMCHKLDFIIRSIAKVSDPEIHILIIGAGAEKNNLETAVRTLRPGNVTIHGLIPKETVPEYLATIDVALINLKKSDLFTTVIPSKIFESAAMNRPILLGVDGEARSLVERYNAGLFFEPENETDFLEKLMLLKNNPALYRRLQEGCHKLATDFDRKLLAGTMIDEIRETMVNHSRQS